MRFDPTSTVRFKARLPAGIAVLEGGRCETALIAAIFAAVLPEEILGQANDWESTMLWSGVKVLGLTRVLSGPFCTALLGDPGADLIKVEAPEGPRVGRIGGNEDDGGQGVPRQNPKAPSGLPGMLELA